MLQFYFLSIFLNAVSGYILFTGAGWDAVSDDEKGFKLSPSNGTFRLVLGIAAAAVGILKILSVISGDVPVIGDLIPALAGLLAGFVLIFDYYRRKTTVDSEKSEKISTLVNANYKWIGIVAMAAAGLHFLFPTVLLL
ncbi:hypothetical protein [Breznakiella homolactica]|uniref:Uncharacterized protein n=1 Tax=Breznakiella homolactica TaxID=2798577 RepID=A0A7T7XKU9_9SPIR|nr:hypothetical protein [Breznakiella homolactica]QQO08062.1 hypothetical protein JFL75_14075 [Breznakiella homolactica]